MLSAQKKVLSIPGGAPFLPTLADAIATTFGSSPLTLADVQVFLPTRRAIRALSTALTQSRGTSKAAFLPSVSALGDVDEEDFLETSGRPEDEVELPPAISPMERTLVLSRMVASKNKAFRGHEHWPAALAAGRELSKLLDSFYTEEIDPSRLSELVPEQYADHWAQSIDFLKIVTEAWPAYLNDQGRMDPAARRVSLIERLRAHWETAKPTSPIIIAGTTASVPAVRRLCASLLDLPNAWLVLPGVDLSLDPRAWDVIDDPHPQAGLKGLLGDLNIDQAQVTSLTSADKEDMTDNGHNRSGLISLALRPAEATDDWRQNIETMTKSDPDLTQCSEGLELVEARSEDEEATIIALRCREVLESDPKTVLVVTSDRFLARRVSLKLRRWNIIVDDSGGQPFHNSLCGTYLQLVASWLVDPADPGACLALLRHPLCGIAYSEEQENPTKRSGIDALDRALRGLSPKSLMPEGGIDALRAKVAQLRDGAPRALAERILADLAQRAGTHLQITEGMTFQSVFDKHLALAEALSVTDETNTTRPPVWQGNDGAVGATLVADVRASCALIETFSAATYRDIFVQLISTGTVRQNAGTHPNIQILGPLEARLQSADQIILGGLNEGTWPGDAGTDPFLSRPMRAELGLPSPERRLGLAAHDFSQLVSSPSVMMTRSLLSGGEPTMPSRWFVRLKNILQGAGGLDARDQSARYRHWASLLDSPDEVRPVHRPSPTPPVEARPRRLYATDIEAWLRDPYGLYAKRCLRLRPLDPMDMAFSGREMGTILHAVFEAAIDPGLPDDDVQPFLHDIFSRIATAHGYTPVDDMYWRHDIKAALIWFEAFSSERAPLVRTHLLEEEGVTAVRGVNPRFEIAARADRIDLREDGRVDIYDYKSRKVPSDKQDKHFSPQLALTALIVREGGFTKLGARSVASYAYLKTLGRDGKPDTVIRDAEVDERIQSTEQLLKQLITAFDQEAQGYHPQPHPEFLNQFGDYDQLSRRREWSVSGEDE
ncbi:MAG: double-strand break repair protein AddB [Pseudomonadota bacterium]